MAFLKGLFDFDKQPELGPSFTSINFPAPDDEGIDWKDTSRRTELKALVDENSIEINCLIPFVKGHIIKNHGLDESVHLEYQAKCRNILLNKNFITDSKKLKLLEEIVKTIDALDFDEYPQTANNLMALMNYISMPKSKGFFLCHRGVWLRERPNVEGALVTILRQKDNPNFVFDENNQFIKDWESNFPRLYTNWQDWQSKLRARKVAQTGRQL